MSNRGKILLAITGAVAGAVCAWLVASRRAPVPPAAGGGSAPASAQTATHPRTGPGAPLSAPAGAASAAATQPTATQGAAMPVLPEALRRGDDVFTPQRWMRRVPVAHCVYVTYDDGKLLWHFKEAVGAAAPATSASQATSAPATQASTEPATSAEARPADAFAQALRAGAQPLPAADITWPAVATMDVVHPLELMQARFPAHNGPLVRAAGPVLVAVNDVAQAEDGTFFVVCTERWNNAGDAAGKDLPEMRVEATAAGGLSVGKVAEVWAPLSHPVMRVAFYLVVPGNAARPGRKIGLTIHVAGATEPIAAQLEAEAIDVPLRAAAESIDDFCGQLDGIAGVRESDYTRGPAGLVESDHRPAEYLPGEFTGRVLTQVALRHELPARPPQTQTRPARP
jgi:hypothetical protein